MGCLIMILLLFAVIFFGIGFAFHVLWVLAAVFFVFWVAGYAFARGRRRVERKHRGLPPR